MEKQQIDDFTKLDVDFSNLDLEIRTSDDTHYYMEYKLKCEMRRWRYYLNGIRKVKKSSAYMESHLYADFFYAR